MNEKETIANNKILLEKYPFLKPRNVWTDEEIEDYDYSWTLLDDLPDGWRKAFGEDICREIMEELVKFDFVDKYRIVQIKEKFGGLRWYDNGIPIGKLSDTYKVFRRKRIEENIEPFYEWKNSLGVNWDTHYLKLSNVENYESPFDENLKPKENYEEIKKKNDESAIEVYFLYEIIEKCRIHDIIRKYEDMSEQICIRCGEPAKWCSKGWISYYCDPCAKKCKNFETGFSPLGDTDD